MMTRWAKSPSPARFDEGRDRLQIGIVAVPGRIQETVNALRALRLHGVQLIQPVPDIVDRVIIAADDLMQAEL